MCFSDSPTPCVGKSFAITSEITNQWLLIIKEPPHNQNLVTLTTQRTSNLLEGDHVSHTCLENSSSSHFLFLLSLSNHPYLTLTFHFMPSEQNCTSVARTTFCDSYIDVMWASWPDSPGTLIIQGDRLLAISFVYPAEQTKAVSQNQETQRRSMSDWERIFLSSGINHRCLPRSHPSYWFDWISI